MIPDLVVGCDAIEIVSQLRKVRNIDSGDPFGNKGSQDFMIPVQGPYNPPSEPFDVPVMFIMLPALA